jgi:ubiquinone/menaquinone biosynthesis C-methylase UbiE
MDVCELTFPDTSFDGVTILEVLEHLHNPEAALHQALRVARRFVIASVPSIPDENPEHRHLFTVNRLREMAVAGGAHNRRSSTSPALGQLKSDRFRMADAGSVFRSVIARDHHYRIKRLPLEGPHGSTLA